MKCQVTFFFISSAFLKENYREVEQFLLDFRSLTSEDEGIVCSR